MVFNLSEEEKHLGLNTKAALTQLANELDAVRRSSFRKWRFSLDSIRRHPPISLPHLVMNLIVWLILLVSVSVDPQLATFISSPCSIVLLVSILVLTLFNIFLSLTIDILSHNGVNRKIQSLCADILDYAQLVDWTASSYMDLNAPTVSTIHCHWTIRDEQLVNLPAILLVRNDVIFIRPGDKFSVHCIELKETVDEPTRSFCPDDCYVPRATEQHQIRPAIHPIMSPLRCRVKVTPSVDFVRDFLNLHLRGESDLDTLFSRGCRSTLLCSIILFVSSMIFSIVKISTTPNLPFSFVLIQPCICVLPVLLLTSPVLWHALDLYELAKILVLVERDTLFSDESHHGRTHSMESLTESIRSLESDLEADDPISWVDITNKLLYLLLRNKEIDWKLVHSFGTMSRLCCADKEGILSLPIPLPDKVCFLKKKHKHRVAPAQRKKSEVSLQPSSDALNTISLTDSDAHMHVMDISHDPKIAYKLDFDDCNWHRFSSSLKPIGLTILLNNCHPLVRPQYNAFAHHISAKTIANLTENEGNLGKRRCLCDLAQLIGFCSNTRSAFSLKFTLGTYQRASRENQIRDQFLKLLSALKQKAPVGHAFGSGMQQKHLGAQYFVQGSADLLLSNFCTDYWNGSTIELLTEFDRKRLLNFYSRHSYSSYCDTFSYSPLLTKVVGGATENYIELPPFHFRSGADDSPRLTPQLTRGMPRTFSVETTLNKSSNLSLTDTDSCLKMQRGQIFLGMVASQYQANSNIVRLVDQLELGCIRFVYFSEENELRSRGFAERLGLESGWNCFISLRPDSGIGSRITTTERDITAHSKINSPMQLDGSCYQWGSAPALINTEISKVTFKGDPEELMLSVNNNDSSITSSSGSEEIEQSGLSSRDENVSGCSTASGQRVPSQEDSDIPYVDQNKSRLPRGISEIRPHLQQIDNVPLQVSLFTDCDIAAVSEMLLIMKQYGERITLLYSSLSVRSCRLAKITDSAVAMVPQLPPTCRNEPVPDVGTPMTSSPVSIACNLLSLPAVYATCRVSLARIIAECRCSVDRLKRPLRAYLSFSIMLSIFLCISSILPPSLSPQQVSFLSLLIIPLFAFATITKNDDPVKAIQFPARRRDLPRRRVLTIRYISLHLALTLPSAFVAFGVCLIFYNGHCSRLVDAEANRTVNLHGSLSNYTACLDPYIWIEPPISGLLAAFQCVIFFFFVLLMGITSYVFVSEDERSIRLSRITAMHGWICCNLLILIVSIFFAGMQLHFNSAWSSLRDLALEVWVVLAFWLIILLPINEIIRRRQLRIRTKEDRAARLHFDTKLGMYSPV